MKFRKAGVDYDQWKKSFKKADDPDMSQEDYDALPEGDDDADKSIKTADLRKSLESFESASAALASGGGAVNREEFLKSRVFSGVASPDEKREYGEILTKSAGGAHSSGSSSLSVRDEVRKSGEGAKSLVDGSEFLKSLVDTVDRSYDDLVKSVRADGQATRGVLLAQGGLLKSMAGQMVEQADVINAQQRVIKSFESRLTGMENQPQARRGAPVPPTNVRGRDIAKSGTDDAGGNGQLSKSQIDQGLMTLVCKAEEKGDTVAMERLGHEIAKSETGGPLRPETYAAVQALYGSGLS